MSFSNPNKKQLENTRKKNILTGDLRFQKKDSLFSACANS